MHFTIPYTEEVLDTNGKKVDVFKIYINGAHHCSARYSSFLKLYEDLKLRFSATDLPNFPPKRILKLSADQLDERKECLEYFLQRLSSSSVHNSHELHTFLQICQQATKGIVKETIRIHIYQMNGERYDIDVQTTDHTRTVLDALANHINLPRKITDKFGLFLLIIHDDSKVSIVRQLQDFEYPYVSLEELRRSANGRIVIRKCIWNPDLESDIINDIVGFDLLYHQIISEIDLGWILVPDEVRQSRLAQLIKRKAKKETLQLARTLDLYGYIHLHDISLCNIPVKKTEVLVSTGNFELLFRNPKNEIEVLNKFSLTRIKGWRICTIIDDENLNGSDQDHRRNYDRPYSATLTFEYLNPSSKVLYSVEVTNKSTDQIILLSMSLKSMAEEYVHYKNEKNLSESQYESFSDGNAKASDSLTTMYKTSMLYTKEIGDDDL